MLTEKGGKALVAFTAKTDTIIVTVGVPNASLAQLDMMLVDWQDQPTEEKELAIINGFAITEDRNDPTRVPDKY